MINNKELDTAIDILEHILECDERTLSNPISDDGWYYDEIHKACKILKDIWTKQDTIEQGNIVASKGD